MWATCMKKKKNFSNELEAIKHKYQRNTRKGKTGVRNVEWKYQSKHSHFIFFLEKTHSLSVRLIGGQGWEPG